MRAMMIRGFTLTKPLVVEPQLFHEPRREVLDHDVRVLDHAEDQRHAVGVLQIDGHAALVHVETRKNIASSPGTSGQFRHDCSPPGGSILMSRRRASRGTGCTSCPLRTASGRGCASRSARARSLRFTSGASLARPRKYGQVRHAIAHCGGVSLITRTYATHAFGVPPRIAPAARPRARQSREAMELAELGTAVAYTPPRAARPNPTRRDDMTGRPRRAFFPTRCWGASRRARQATTATTDFSPKTSPT